MIAQEEVIRRCCLLLNVYNYACMRDSVVISNMPSYLIHEGTSVSYPPMAQRLEYGVVLFSYINHEQ